MATFSLSTHLVPEDRRLEYLRDQLLLPHLQMDIEALGAEAFSGFMQAFDFGPVNIALTSLTSARLIRDARQARMTPDQLVYFDFMLSGRLTVEQDGRALTSAAKQCVVSSAVRPYVNLLQADTGPAQMLTLSVPQAFLLRRYAQPAWGMEAIDLIGGPARLLATTVTQALEEVDYLSASERSVLGGTLVELVRLASGTAPSPHKRRDATFQRITEAVSASFADPNVSPSDIARRSGVSERTMRRVLAENDTTLTDLLQEWRVENMRRLLAQRTSGHPSITAIAFASGFSDSGTASRAFRSIHGCPPSDYLVASIE